VAKGHIEIGGPDLLASVASEDAYKAVDLLIDKLERSLHRRAEVFKARRHRNTPLGELSS
jgi:putative sigma-54 modulation protein